MALVLDGSNGITFPNASTQNTGVANTSAILSLIGPKGLATPYLGTGAVLQVAQTTTSATVTNSSTTFVSTGLSLSITPTSASSKILIMAYVPIRMGSSNGITCAVRINKNSGTVLMTDTFLNNVAAIVDISYPISLVYLDSPATTSSTNYTIEFNQPTSASPYAYPTVNYSGVSHICTLTLMEIAA